MAGSFRKEVLPGAQQDRTRFREQTDLTLSETLVDETSVKVAAPSVGNKPVTTLRRPLEGLATL
jgi:hypothetical protein